MDSYQKETEALGYAILLKLCSKEIDLQQLFDFMAAIYVGFGTASDVDAVVEFCCSAHEFQHGRAQEVCSKMLNYQMTHRDIAIIGMAMNLKVSQVESIVRLAISQKCTGEMSGMAEKLMDALVKARKLQEEKEKDA